MRFIFDCNNVYSSRDFPPAGRKTFFEKYSKGALISRIYQVHKKALKCRIIHMIAHDFTHVHTRKNQRIQ
jgi:hypothetical protein